MTMGQQLVHGSPIMMTMGGFTNYDDDGWFGRLDDSPIMTISQQSWQLLGVIPMGIIGQLYRKYPRSIKEVQAACRLFCIW